MAYPMVADAGVPSAGPATVAARLGADKVPAELVILVDISQSMSGSHGGLYPQVRTQLPQFLTAVARQDPQDRVAVVVFGNRNDTHTIYTGPPTPDIPLPGDATSIGTDLGYAFQLALGDLAQAPASIQLGDVMLLSDGGLWAPSDPVYDGGRGYSAPGWATLRRQVQGLGVPVTGYGLPLTSNTAVIDAQDRALTACFGSQQLVLSSNFGDLSAQLTGTQQKILASRVALAARPDSGRGVRVTWAAPPGTNGPVRLDLPSGHANLSVRLTSGTRRIPLDARNLSVHATGFPVSVTATIPPGDIALMPGQSVTLPVHLSWTPETSATGPAEGTLKLNGQVYSPFTSAIKNYYLDRSFTVGGFSGSTSPSFPATIPSSLGFLGLLLIILILLAVIAVLGGVAFYRARLNGFLTVSGVGVGGQLTLPSRPWFSGRMDQAVGIPGTLHVRGNPLNRTMRVRLRSPRLPAGENTIRPGGRTMISGLMVTHDERVSDSAETRSGAAPTEPWSR
jgi:hypothetical protein